MSPKCGNQMNLYVLITIRQSSLFFLLGPSITNVNINLQVINICDLKAFQSIQSNEIKQQEESCTV